MNSCILNFNLDEALYQECADTNAPFSSNMGFPCWSLPQQEPASLPLLVNNSKCFVAATRSRIYHTCSVCHNIQENTRNPLSGSAHRSKLEPLCKYCSLSVKDFCFIILYLV